MERSLSRKSRDYAAPVPWGIAIAIFGTEERLKAGVPESTWRGWLNDEPPAVPAYHVMPKLLEWWASRADVIAKARDEERVLIIDELSRGRPELSRDQESPAG